MRINRKYPIEVVMDAINEYIAKNQSSLTFEYIMLDHVNDSVEQAQQLADLLADKKRLSYVNLIL